MRSLLICVSVIIGISLCTLSAQAAPAARLALVIGNDSYPGNELRNARNDARSVADALKLDGYQTTLELDVNRHAMIKVIDQFAGDINPGDAVVFYYAGHGLQVSGENYLVPTDFVVTTPDDVRTQGFALSSLLELLSTHGATTQVIILDACRDNPFLGTRSLHGGWASIGTSAGTFIAFGTSPGSTASDDPSQPHGLFTLSLLKYLSTSSLDIERMFQQVRLDVVQQSHGQQVPWTASSLVGSFHIRPELDMGSNSVPSSLLGVASGDVEAPSRSLSPQQTTTISQANGGQTVTATGTVCIQLQQALTEIQKGQLDSAIGTLQSVLATDPQSSIAANLLGLILQSTGHDAASSEVLGREITLAPNDVDARIDRCLTESNVNPASAVTDCEAAIKMDPDSADAHVALANALFLGGQVKRSYDEATRSIKLSPTESVAFALRGRIAATQGYSAIAQQDFQRAVRLQLSADTSQK
ncbi:MAG: caspase family protein [Silvibacterium sp.]